MSVLENLEPKKVFDFFEQLCAIPHGSGNTAKISEFLRRFGEERGLETHKDDLGNIIIIKEATAGYENAEAVILQGHMDMVCEKAADCDIDMDTEGLRLKVEGDILFAEGTTLGGDNGIAVAMALALLDSDDIPHPRLEVVITVDEEIGMLGAIGLDVSPLKATRMINLDSEDEGVFTVSCAGGITARCALPLSYADFCGEAIKIRVGGLKGGHSGVEIHKGLGNSNILMGRLLYAISKAADIRLAAVNGGMKDNAIPRESAAVILTSDAAAVKKICEQFDAAFKNEYVVTDPEVFASYDSIESNARAMDKESTDRVIAFLVCSPNGVQAMSADIDGLVQTSLNLGVVKTEEDKLVAVQCIRSSVESNKQMLMDKAQALCLALGGTTEFFGDYSAWQYQQVSPLRDLLCEVYTEQTGKAPKIEAIHAGLECGVFAGKIPNLDCISIGPDLKEIHTCRERLYISSAKRLWEMLIEVLKRMK